MRILAALGVLIFVTLCLGADPLVPAVRDAVEPEIVKHVPEARKAALADLALADTIPARFKPALRQQAVKDPWAALAALERRGLDLGTTARGGLKNLPVVVNRANHFLDRPAGKPPIVPRGELVTLDDHLRYITTILDAAEKLREEAVAKLTPKERRTMFDRPPVLIREFGPQSALNEKTRPRLEGDLECCTTWEEKIDGRAFANAVQTLLLLTDPSYLDGLRAVMAKATPLPAAATVGITGEVLAAKDTRHGLIVLGGAKANTFDLKRPVAFLADLGGDDTYKGVIAASYDADHPFGVAVDFAGDDTYAPSELGLATGRLGCGCLIDRGGNDTYTLAAGCGGCGFAGFGLLVDEAGRDTYTGDRFSLGAAVAGLGLLLDVAGDDTYTAPGYALGIGGPCGVG
ncbi:MAG TPA: hypothetical protein VMZ71_00710, partial [Gemmataceae bacterium]|nr:hypothetical protein [Gemmataceae bacterium]